MTAKRVGALAAVVILAAGAAACVPKLQRPEVRLVSVQVAGLGLTGGRIKVRLQVYNPNTFVLDADSLTYDVDLAQDTSGERWAKLAQGTYAHTIRVEAQDSTRVDIPIEFRYSGLGDAFRALMERGTFDYRIQGEVALQAPIRRKMPYRHRGAVSMAGAR